MTHKVLHRLGVPPGPQFRVCRIKHGLFWVERRQGRNWRVVSFTFTGPSAEEDALVDADYRLERATRR